MGAKRQAKKQLAIEAEKAKIRQAQQAKVAKRERREQAVRDNAARRAALSPDERHREDRLMAIVAVVLVVLVGGCIYIGSQSDDDTDTASGSGTGVDSAEVTDEPEEADPALGFEACKDFVKRELRAPGTASFRNYYEDDGEVQTSVDGDEVTIISTVDAENGFGGEVREPFVCTVRDDGDSWVAVSVVVG